MNTRPGAVLLDMDGLMLDTERMVLAAFEAAAAELGHVVPADLFPSLIGRTSRDSAGLLESAFGAGFPLETFRRLTQANYELDIARNGIARKAGIVELLVHLREQAVPFACATSTARARAWWKLEQAGLAEWFVTLVGGDEVSHGKPAPDIFLEAAARLDVSAPRCIVLEDSPAGVSAAAAAGMTPIMVPDLVAPDARARNLAHAVVGDLHEARALIGGWLAGVGPERAPGGRGRP